MAFFRHSGTGVVFGERYWRVNISGSHARAKKTACFFVRRRVNKHENLKKNYSQNTTI